MNICVIIGTRGEVIGMAPVILEIKKHDFPFLMIHTGQHYDSEMRFELMNDLELPEPDHLLSCKAGNHGEQIGSILMEVSKILRRARPDIVLIQGNNNSTVASAIACTGIGIPFGHIESGVRHGYHLGDTNRRIVERCAAYRFAPFEEAKRNLESEGVCDAVHMVGDTYLDAFKLYSTKILNSRIIENLNLKKKDYAIVSIHTRLNRSTKFLQSLLEALNLVKDFIFIWALHPSLRNNIQKACSKIRINKERIIFTPSIPYSDFQKLIHSSKLVITDSGSTQEEAYLNDKPCIALVNEEIKLSPYPMLVRRGWVKTISNVRDLPSAIQLSLNEEKNKRDISIFGDGRTSKKIINIIKY